MIAVILQSIEAMYIFHYIACFATIAMGAYLITMSFNGFKKDNLQSINKMAKEKKSETEIFEPFSRFNRTHAEVKQLS